MIGRHLVISAADRQPSGNDLPDAIHHGSAEVLVLICRNAEPYHGLLYQRTGTSFFGQRDCDGPLFRDSDRPPNRICIQICDRPQKRRDLAVALRKVVHGSDLSFMIDELDRAFALTDRTVDCLPVFCRSDEIRLRLLDEKLQRNGRRKLEHMPLIPQKL